MEDEYIAPNRFAADPVGRGKKYTITGIYCTRATVCPYRLDLLHAFGAISSSSIWQAYLDTTY